jgi:hypothetical protein
MVYKLGEVLHYVQVSFYNCIMYNFIDLIVKNTLCTLCKTILLVHIRRSLSWDHQMIILFYL